MRARPDVFAQVDTPELSAVHAISINQHIAGVTRLRIVLAVGRIPFHNHFVGLVAVHIGHHAIAGDVIKIAALGGTSRGAVERNIEIAFGQYPHRSRFDHLARHHSLYRIFTGGSTGVVHVICPVADGRIVQLNPVAIHIETHLHGVVDKPTPVDQVTAAAAHISSHRCPVEGFGIEHPGTPGKRKGHSHHQIGIGHL